jgi:hypothetical protein
MRADPNRTLPIVPEGTQYDGIIMDAAYDSINEVIWGYIYNDSKKRFAQGEYVHTSYLPIPLGQDEALEEKVYSTLNSKYYVVPKKD